MCRAHVFVLHSHHNDQTLQKEPATGQLSLQSGWVLLLWAELNLPGKENHRFAYEEGATEEQNPRHVSSVNTHHDCAIKL